jgi:hypothetical protein
MGPSSTGESWLKQQWKCIMVAEQVQLELKAWGSLAADAVQQARQRLQVVVLVQLKRHPAGTSKDSVPAGP